mmetsp:Transcript_68344/g.192739  ORF Transcript_68344/g.192739 Transcript_68344/m.192739 type:complete len:235 (-) Transcript_68344:1087-1791(-)
MVAIRVVFDAAEPRNSMPSSGAAKRARHCPGWMTGFGSSGSPSVFAFLAPFSPSALDDAYAAISARFSASSSFTGSPRMFCSTREYFTLRAPALSWRRSSTAKANTSPSGLSPPGRRPEPSTDRSDLASCSRKYCRNSPASCWRPDANSGWFLLMSARNICGATRSRGSSSSSPSFHGGAYRLPHRPLASFAVWLRRSCGCSGGGPRERIWRPSSRYRSLSSGTATSIWIAEFM